MTPSKNTCRSSHIGLSTALIVSFLLLTSFNSVCRGATSSDTDALAKGKRYLQERTVNSDSYYADLDNVNRSIQFLKQALDDTHTRREAAELLIKAYYIKGTFSALPLSKKQKIFEKGKRLGEKMIEEYPNSLKIKFGYLGNLGRWSEVHGVFAAALEGVVGTMRSVVKDIIRLDPHFDGAGGYRILGFIHYKTPYIPLYTSWASNKKAIKYVKKAVEMYPGHPGNQYYCGKLLYEMGRYQQAKPHLGKVLEIQPRDHWILRDRRFQHLARQMLSKIREME